MQHLDEDVAKSSKFFTQPGHEYLAVVYGSVTFSAGNIQKSVMFVTTEYWAAT